MPEEAVSDNGSHVVSIEFQYSPEDAQWSTPEQPCVIRCRVNWQNAGYLQLKVDYSKNNHEVQIRKEEALNVFTGIRLVNLAFNGIVK